MVTWRRCAMRMGEPGSEVRLTAASLTGSLAGEPGGDFTGGAAQLEAVPLDLDAIGGRWAYADGVLRIDGAQFRLSDRPGANGAEARFTPLTARELQGRMGELLLEGELGRYLLLRRGKKQYRLVEWVDEFARPQ